MAEPNSIIPAKFLNTLRLLHPHELIDHLAFKNAEDGRQRLDLQPLRELLVRVCVELREHELAIRILYHSLEHGRKLCLESGAERDR